MARNKVTLAYIRNDSERKASYKKRKRGFLKKIHELKVFCEIEACAIIYSPYDRHPVVYPSYEGARTILARFTSLPPMDQTRKMYNQNSFNRERTQKAQETLRRVLRDNKRKQMKLFLVRFIKGMVSPFDFNLADYAVMKQVIHEFISDRRARYQNQEGQGLALPPPLGPLDNLAPPPPAPGPLDNSAPPPPPPLLEPSYQFPLGTDSMVISNNFNSNDEYQYQSNFFPDQSSMVRFAPQPFSTPMLLVPMTVPENNVAASMGSGGGGDENSDNSFPWHLLENASVMDGGILGWNEGKVMPPYSNLAFNKFNDNILKNNNDNTFINNNNNNITFINPSGSDASTGSDVIPNHSFNQASSYGEPGAGFDPNSTGSVMNPNPSFNPSRSYASPGFGFDPNSSFTFMPTPSISNVAPGSGNNK